MAAIGWINLHTQCTYKYKKYKRIVQQTTK